LVAGDRCYYSIAVVGIDYLRYAMRTILTIG
jgi:hypothetical protein